MGVQLKPPAGTFEGMVYPDTHPLTVDSTYVRQVGMFHIPAALRQHAYESLGDLSGDEWWTVGEFRYAGQDYDTAVARRILRDGRMTMEFGIEGEG